MHAEQPIGVNDAAGTALRHWTAERKAELVLRLLRGEPFDVVANDGQVTAEELDRWRCSLLENGMRGLERIVDPNDPYAQLRSWLSRAHSR